MYQQVLVITAENAGSNIGSGRPLTFQLKVRILLASADLDETMVKSGALIGPYFVGSRPLSV
jgi:hypothetical protein